MKLVKLTPYTELIGFDCGDEDLNNFLVEDAKGFLDKRIATSYILENPNYSAFCFLTVDAYLSAIDFYQKNDFKILSEKLLNDHTRLMFFDMMELE